jgi:hypothetical protein
VIFATNNNAGPMIFSGERPGQRPCPAFDLATDHYGNISTVVLNSRRTSGVHKNSGPALTPSSARSRDAGPYNERLIDSDKYTTGTSTNPRFSQQPGPRTATTEPLRSSLEIEFPTIRPRVEQPACEPCQNASSQRETSSMTFRGCEPLSLAEALTTIHHAPDANIPLWALPKNGGKKKKPINYGSLPVREIDRGLPIIAHLMAAHDGELYFGINSTPDYQRAILNEVTGLPKHSRDSERFRYLNAVALDCDLRKADATFAQLAETFLASLDASAIPHPSILCDSGQGLWALWLLRDARRPEDPLTAHEGCRNLREIISRAMVERFAHMNADINCIDVSRIMRVPGSRNPKEGSRGTVRFYKLSDRVFNLYELKDALNIRAQKTSLKPDSDETRVKNENKVRAGRQRYALPLAGLRYLWTLRGGFRKGQKRPVMLYFLAVLLRKNRVAPDLAYAECVRFGAQCRPPLDASKINSVLREAAKCRGQFFNITLINRLQITEEEQSQIAEVTGWLRNKGPAMTQEERNAAAGIAIERRRNLVAELLASLPENLSARTFALIAKRSLYCSHGLTVSEKTLRNDLRKIRERQKPTAKPKTKTGGPAALDRFAPVSVGMTGQCDLLLKNAVNLPHLNTQADHVSHRLAGGVQ